MITANETITNENTTAAVPQMALRREICSPTNEEKN